MHIQLKHDNNYSKQLKCFILATYRTETFVYHIHFLGSNINNISFDFVVVRLDMFYVFKYSQHAYST